ncbi:MAG: ferritin-like domain-containing protein [Acidobacteria bacterium]|nr:ferritin-like domain-containing protein [Acidobacteriota bacterium]
MNHESLNRRYYLKTLARISIVPCVTAVPIVESNALGSDISILTAAAALELQAIAAYKAGALSGKLSPIVLGAAVGFLHDHQEHAAAINKTIEALGGTPVSPLRRYVFGPLPDETTILAIALELEQGAVDAYSALATNIENRDVLKAAAGILVDEVKHVVLIRSVLGLEVL